MDAKWFTHTAQDLTMVLAAIKKVPPKVAARILNLGVAKVGALGATSGVFGIAALFGTAGTGTTIGSLSGAAATSATLAWIGGSVATGTAVIAAVAIGAGWAAQRVWKGKPRRQEALSDFEEEIVRDCTELGIAFQAEAASLAPPDSNTLEMVIKDRLEPLVSKLGDYLHTDSYREIATGSISVGSRARIEYRRRKLQSRIHDVQQWIIETSNTHRIYIDIVPAVLLKLLDSNTHEFTADEMMVLEALRRSDNDLATAGVDDIATYLSGYSPEQLAGISNNVKGIYHEIKFAAAENTDGDDIQAQLYELTNHPGADVRLTNIATGDFTDVQLKSTNSWQHVAEHQARYPEITVLTTQDVSEELPDVESSGFSNSDLSEDVNNTFDSISDDNSWIGGSVATSGLLSLAVNSKAVWSGQQSRSSAARKTLEDVGVASASAVIIEILVG